MHVVGSTGVGKTESVLLPILKRDIELGNGAIIMAFPFLVQILVLQERL